MNKNLAMAFIPLILFGVIFGIGYAGISSFTASHTRGNPVVGYSSFSSSASSSNSTTGLQLSLVLNSTRITPNQSVGINISEYNFLSTINNVTASNNWAMQGLRLGPCGSSFPFGMALFHGYYSTANVSSGAPLYLYNPRGIYGCPAFYSNYYRFEPSSDIATIQVLGSALPVSYSASVGNYWDNSGSEHSLGVGVYTVAVGDEWGQLVILHLAVVPSAQAQQIIVQRGTSFRVADSGDHPGGHLAIRFTVNSSATLGGSYSSYTPGQYPNGTATYYPINAAVYLMTSAEFATMNGTGILHEFVVPSDYLHSTGFSTSGLFNWAISSGSYYLWIQGQGTTNGCCPLEGTEVVYFTSDAVTVVSS